MNAIAQNTSALVGSTCSVDDFDFNAAVARYARRNEQIKGNTKDSRSLKRNKLISGVCAVFRDTYPSIFAKRDEKGNIIPGVQRVPPEYFEKIEKAVDDYIAATLKELCLDTLTWTRRHVHRARQHIFVEVRTAKDEQELDWQQQHAACLFAQGAVRRRIEDLDKANRLTDDKYLKLCEQQKALELTMENINAHLTPEVREKLAKL